MSITVMNAVFDRYPKGGGEFVLALSLADHARDDGTHIFPSVERLARKTRQSVRAVQYNLKSMLTTGWLMLVNDGDGGRGRHRVYRISPAWLNGADINGAEIAPFGEKETVQNIPIKGANSDAKGCNLLHPPYNKEEPSNNHQNTLSPAARASRLTSDWVLPKTFGDWALQTYPDWTPDFVQERGNKFRDYWAAVPGKAGLKIDWLATWRNFCLKEAEYLARTSRTVEIGKSVVAWWSSDALTIAEGAKYGIKPNPGEFMQAFKGRVHGAAVAAQVAVSFSPALAVASAPETTTVSPMVSSIKTTGSTPVLSPEAVAARRAEIRKALELARQGVLKAAERMRSPVEPSGGIGTPAETDRGQVVINTDVMPPVPVGSVSSRRIEDTERKPTPEQINVPRMMPRQRPDRTGLSWIQNLANNAKHGLTAPLPAHELFAMATSSNAPLAAAVRTATIKRGWQAAMCGATKVARDG